jgi:hypothetical protein
MSAEEQRVELSLPAEESAVGSDKPKSRIVLTGGGGRNILNQNHFRLKKSRYFLLIMTC